MAIVCDGTSTNHHFRNEEIIYRVHNDFASDAPRMADLLHLIKMIKKLLVEELMVRWAKRHGYLFAVLWPTDFMETSLRHLFG